jgi:hypothetical protein
MRPLPSCTRTSTIALLLSALALPACAGSSAPVSVAPAPAGTPATASPTGGTSGSAPSPAVQTRWRTTTSPHLDLWLHAFASISDDSSLVPLYRKGYRDSVKAARAQSNTLSALDGNRATLAARLATSPQYLPAQFLPFEFGSWEEMKLAADRFLQFEGEPRRASDQNTASRVALFASIFSTPADREWLRLFMASAHDENTRWFAAEHQRVSRERQAVVSAVDTLWSRTYQAKFERFLNNTGQRNGEIVLSLPLGGEGRTGNGRERQTVVAVTWPGRAEDAMDALLVFAHEITGSLVGGVVTDNTTPAEAREGLSDRYVASGQTRAGAMLLAKVAPETLEPYMRYYLGQAGVRSGGSVADTFARTFALPKAITDGLLRQIEIVLGGI